MAEGTSKKCKLRDCLFKKASFVDCRYFNCICVEFELARCQVDVECAFEATARWNAVMQLCSRPSVERQMSGVRVLVGLLEALLLILLRVSMVWVGFRAGSKAKEGEACLALERLGLDGYRFALTSVS
jgi:hypothetical protein